MRIPPAEEGLYSIIVLSRAADGTVSSSGGAAFLVTGSEGVGSTATTNPSAAPSTDAPTATSTSRGGWSFSWPWAVALLAVGALVGALIARRRPS